MKIRIVVLCALLAVLSAGVSPAQQAPAVTAIKAGRLIDPETGTSAAGQVILIEGERITAVGANLAIPAGTAVIDLSKLTVLPELVEATLTWQ